MDPYIINMGEWTLNDSFYVEQLSRLPLLSITQLQAYNQGLIRIHAITNTLDTTMVDINGNNSYSEPCYIEILKPLDPALQRGGFSISVFGYL